MDIQNYAEGKWVAGLEKGTPLINAVNGEIVGHASSKGIDFEKMIAYGRAVGTPNLQKFTFHDRARMLKKVAMYLNQHKDELYPISYKTGATKLDSWIDIEGGIGNLFIYSGKGRRELPDRNTLVDGDTEKISREGTFVGQHVYMPMKGVAIHINAFNFPVWGMLEKIAVNILAGMSSIVKPATLTSYLTYAAVKKIIESKILPEGTLQLITGSASGLLDGVNHTDVVTFTGSLETGKMLRSTPSIVDNNVKFNMEADSLNCSILGKDANPSTPEFNLFIKEVATEMTVKSGQKCTAIRRMIIPEEWVGEVSQAIQHRLDKITVGNPKNKHVKMGALASMGQREEVRERVEQLKSECDLIYEKPLDLVDASEEKGAFMPCTVLLSKNPLASTKVHCVEAFGPVSTIVPYKTTDEAIQLAKMGKGSLVGSIVSHNPDFVRETVLGIGTEHGRILILDRDCAKESTGHGSPLPHLIHGGPGRSGGGEEMGGIRGVKHYMQRVALQGSPTKITKVINRYVPGAQQDICDIHPFRHYYNDLRVGQTLITHRRTITETDVVNFANISGDNFYAHMDITSLEGTMFESRVVHGYFVLSAAAGLFVDPKKGPVIANYGIDYCRFLEPVYVNDTIWVKLTCKEKIDKDNKGGEQPAGIVKWNVEIINQKNITVGIATILTLVAKKGEDFIEFSTELIDKCLFKLKAKDKPGWGKFTAQQMVEHLIDSVSISVGKPEVEVVYNEKMDALKRSLENNVPMLKNFQLPSHKKGLPSLRFATLEEAKKELSHSVNTFYEHYGKNPTIIHNNYVFGPLNFRKWKRLHMKHFTHHFRQFNIY